MTTKDQVFAALADCDLRKARKILYQAGKTHEVALKAFRMIDNAVSGKIDAYSAACRVKSMLMLEVIP
ncbi:MAG: hypothetical protein HGB35_00125 [Geobacteraceae bacterium]|nr:hypothetical protein [Geobacteraceae bacterium]